ncbi:MAG TPA: crosslink repair DNA glycosylase YcaQ family protein [Trebonia sp.]|nr:crosslink repair DNA glycosylase YcaQ family protein [Trebonia sp.]
MQLWGPRFNVFVVPARDHAVFTLGTLPDDAKGRRRAADLAACLREFLDGTSAAAARLELARRYLHVYGPVTSQAFAQWSGIGARGAATAFEALGESLTPVRTPAGEAWILSADDGLLIGGEVAGTWRRAGTVLIAGTWRRAGTVLTATPWSPRRSPCRCRAPSAGSPSGGVLTGHAGYDERVMRRRRVPRPTRRGRVRR